jgi:uncharacterized protein
MQDILKKAISKIAGLAIIGLIVSLSGCSNPKPKILLITGGHDFDTVEFYELFNSFTEFKTVSMSQPAANQFIASGNARTFDILVFYDSWQEISENEKYAYLELTRQGKPFLFLHHSLVSYQNWDEFSLIRGGRYPKSNPPDSINDGRYKHGLELLIIVQDANNPITKGMKEFSIRDEGYNNIILKEGITPLLKTDNPDCSKFFAWTNRYNNSKVVYIMGGHDKFAYENENYRELIKNSLKYLSGLN